MEGLNMKLFALGVRTSIALAVVAALSSIASAQTPLDYKTAFEYAQKGDKPLLVMVSATWCPPCQQMKQTTIPQLLQKGTLKDCHWASVDLDQEKDLARQLIGNRGVPQLIMFEKKDGQWVRRFLVGYKDVNVVEAFVAQSRIIRTAQAGTNEVPSGPNSSSKNIKN